MGTTELWSQEEEPDHFLEIEDSDPSQTSEISLSMISHNIDDVTKTIENLVEPQQEIRVIPEYNPPSHLSSMIVHRLPDKDVDPGTCPLVSLCSHSLPSIHTEDFYSGFTVSTLVHEVPESSEGETEISVWSMETGKKTPLEDTDIPGTETHLSMVTHEITDRVEIMLMEEETISMAAHTLHSIEEQDSGTPLSMVSHQIHPPERKELEDINYINEMNKSDTLKYRESDTNQEEKDHMLSSLVSHQVITDDVSHLHSMVAHSLLNTEELEIETFPTMVSHHTQKFYEDEGRIDVTDNDSFKLEDIDAIEVEGSDILPVSMIQHVRTQDPSQHMLSMTAHGVITTEEQDMGILSSMISHQRFHLNNDDENQEITNYSKTGHSKDYTLKSEDDILPSLVTHQMTMNTEDESEAMLSMTSHSPLHIEKKDTETLSSMVTHHVSPLESSNLSISHIETESSKYDVYDNIQEESDDIFLTSVAHELMITEDQYPYLISMTAHSLKHNEEQDAGYLTSMVTHQILPLHSHQFDDSFTENIHKCEKDGIIKEEKDCMFPTFVAHQVPIEDSSQNLFSMKAHSLLNLEELDSGIHNSMMTHQLFVIQSDDQSIGVTEIDNSADKKTDIIEQEKGFMFSSSVTQQVNPENPSQNMISMSVHGLQTTMEQDAETVYPIIGDQLLLLAKHESRNTTNEIDNSEYDGNDTNLEKGEFKSPSSLTHQVSIRDPTPEMNTMVAYNHPDMEHQDSGTSLSMVTHLTEIIDNRLSKDTVIGTEY